MLFPQSTDCNIAPLVCDSHNNTPSTGDGHCYPLHSGDGPIPIPDTPSAFLTLPNYGSIAAAASTTDGFLSVFNNLSLAKGGGSGNLGFKYLDSYDTQACARDCSGVNHCFAFNICKPSLYQLPPPSYLTYPLHNRLRAGSYSPARATLSKSSLNHKHQMRVFKEFSKNNDTDYTGVIQEQFEVLIRGSNGYVKTTLGPIKTAAAGRVDVPSLTRTALMVTMLVSSVVAFSSFG